MFARPVPDSTDPMVALLSGWVTRCGPPRAGSRRTARIFERDQPWAEARLPLVVDRVRDRLVRLANWLGDAEWHEGTFTGGDLMLVSVLLRLRSSGLLDEFPTLAAYVAPGEA